MSKVQALSIAPVNDIMLQSLNNVECLENSVYSCGTVSNSSIAECFGSVEMWWSRCS